MRILIINGPNLNLLGVREPGIYGTDSMQREMERIGEIFPSHDVRLFQSNHEGELIDVLHRAWINDEADGIILNPGGLTHYSISLADAVAAVGLPVVELHISNIFAREDFRSRSVVSPVASGVISGFGIRGYELAVNALIDLVEKR